MACSFSAAESPSGSLVPESLSSRKTISSRDNDVLGPDRPPAQGSPSHLARSCRCLKLRCWACSSLCSLHAVHGISRGCTPSPRSLARIRAMSCSWSQPKGLPGVIREDVALISSASVGRVFTGHLKKWRRQTESAVAFFTQFSEFTFGISVTTIWRLERARRHGPSCMGGYGDFGGHGLSPWLVAPAKLIAGAQVIR